jgi:hypothetical protein
MELLPAACGTLDAPGRGVGTPGIWLPEEREQHVVVRGQPVGMSFAALERQLLLLLAELGSFELGARVAQLALHVVESQSLMVSLRLLCRWRLLPRNTLPRGRRAVEARGAGGRLPPLLLLLLLLLLGRRGSRHRTHTERGETLLDGLCHSGAIGLLVVIVVVVIVPLTHSAAVLLELLA